MSLLNDNFIININSIDDIPPGDRRAAFFFIYFDSRILSDIVAFIL